MYTKNQTASGNSTPMSEPCTYISQARLKRLINQDSDFKGKISSLLLELDFKGDELAGCMETLENFFHAYISSEEWEFECNDKGWIIIQYKAIRYILSELDSIFKQYCLGGYRHLFNNQNQSNERNK